MEFGQTVDYTANGTDDPEFLISTNPGEPVKPLGKSHPAVNFENYAWQSKRYWQIRMQSRHSFSMRLTVESTDAPRDGFGKNECLQKIIRSSVSRIYHRSPQWLKI